MVTSSLLNITYRIKKMLRTEVDANMQDGHMFPYKQ